MTGTWTIESDYGWTGTITVTPDNKNCSIEHEDGSGAIGNFEEFTAAGGQFNGVCFFTEQDDGTYGCDNFTASGTYDDDTAKCEIHPAGDNEDKVAATWKWTKHD